MKAFLDTNVVLDVLTRREPFYSDSARVWSLAERGEIRGVVSAVSLTNVFYVARKHSGAAVARAMLDDIRRCVSFSACDASVIDRAIESPFSDFEDALQYFSALAAGVDLIVTRNVVDYAEAELTVLTPTAFLATRRI